MLFRKPLTPKKGSHKTDETICNHCGKSVTNYDSNLSEITHDQMDNLIIDEEQTAQLTKTVMKNVMAQVTPLVETLGKAAEQHKQEQSGSAKPTEQSFENQLQQLSSSAEERIKIQEKKIALRMQKLSSRF